MAQQLNFTDVAVIVDKLGALLDQIDSLSVDAQALKEQLYLHGKGAYAGRLYTSTVTHAPVVKTVKWASVAGEMEVPQSIIDKHTTTKFDKMSVSVKQLSN
jgi:hypothetical protein